MYTDSNCLNTVHVQYLFCSPSVPGFQIAAYLFALLSTYTETDAGTSKYTNPAQGSPKAEIPTSTRRGYISAGPGSTVHFLLSALGGIELRETLRHDE